MALDYTYKKYKDAYTVENTGIASFNYKIQIKDCDSLNEYKSGTINPGKIFTLPITFLDAVYVVTLYDDNEEVVLDDILQYNNTLLNFIDGTEELLCGCKECDECEECNKCESFLSTLNYALAFFHVNSPRYDNYLLTFSNEMKCNYSQEILCLITKLNATGKGEIEKLTKLNIALYYLVFYLLDLAQAQDLEEAEYIKTKYKSSKILKCIRRLGIDIDNFNDELFSDMTVYYWQLSDTVQDIDDVIPLVTDIYLATKNSLPFETFEEGHIVNYSDIGRAVFAIKETDILNFELVDSMGNDITDEFDNHYYPTTHTVLFVSKLVVPYSNVYFKFKKLTYTP